MRSILVAGIALLYTYNINAQDTSSSDTHVLSIGLSNLSRFVGNGSGPSNFPYVQYSIVGNQGLVATGFGGAGGKSSDASWYEFISFLGFRKFFLGDFGEKGLYAGSDLSYYRGSSDAPEITITTNRAGLTLLLGAHLLIHKKISLSLESDLAILYSETINSTLGRATGWGLNQFKGLAFTVNYQISN